FGVGGDPRLAVRIGDGRAFLREPGPRYGLIFSDVYQSLIFVPYQLATKEFFLAARSRLDDDGVFAANIVGDLTASGPSFLFSEMRTFREVFPNSYFFAVQPPEPGAIRNVIFVGVNGDRRFDAAGQEALADPDGFIRGLAERRIEPDDAALAASPVLTDDYAPVEFLAAKGFLEPGRRPAPFHGVP
ncbi:MAG TPA: fused MFS/spermidine synthase, partial [Patescibacteria group bacterium]|nr:fused MFS/spermidine synthase [Patescibacteria group bacterium]